MSSSENSLTELLRDLCQKNVSVLRDTFSQEQSWQSLSTITSAIITALRNGGKLLLCGNGGSAADSQHIAAEFIGRFKRERRSLPAIALTTDTSILTCVANDYSFHDIFKRQVEGLGNAGDVFIGISTSGNSENVIRAAVAARAAGLTTISFTGGSGGSLRGLTDHNFNVPSEYTPFIQSGHEIALHAMCEVVEANLADESRK